jgi:hypothetical protein
VDPIYYVSARDTGVFMGSGTVFFDDETYGCTQEPFVYDPEIEQAHWNGSAWAVTPAG